MATTISQILDAREIRILAIQRAIEAGLPMPDSRKHAVGRKQTPTSQAPKDSTQSCMEKWSADLVRPLAGAVLIAIQDTARRKVRGEKLRYW